MNPSAAGRKEKMYFTLDEGDWHGFSSESLWADTQNSASEARILNAPFFIKGVSNNDIIAYKTLDEKHWFYEMREKSGHATLRLLIRDFEKSKAPVMERLSLLEQSGCTFEGASLGVAKIFSVDVPGCVASAEVVRIVDVGVELDYWDAEMGDAAGREGFWHY